MVDTRIRSRSRDPKFVPCFPVYSTARNASVVGPCFDADIEFVGGGVVDDTGNGLDTDAVAAAEDVEFHVGRLGQPDFEPCVLPTCSSEIADLPHRRQKMWDKAWCMVMPAPLSPRGPGKRCRSRSRQELCRLLMAYHCFASPRH